MRRGATARAFPRRSNNIRSFQFVFLLLTLVYAAIRLAFFVVVAGARQKDGLWKPVSINSLMLTCVALRR